VQVRPLPTRTDDVTPCCGRDTHSATSPGTAGTGEIASFTHRTDLKRFPKAYPNRIGLSVAVPAQPDT